MIKCSSAIANEWRVNKMLSRTATFLVKGEQKWLMEHTKNNVCKKTSFDKKVVGGDLDGRIQAGSFRQLWVSKSTKQAVQFDIFETLAYQDSKIRKEIGDCST